MNTPMDICKCKHARSGHYQNRGTCMGQPGCTCLEYVQKSARYQTTEYNRSERLFGRLRDIYSSAKSFHSSHKEILAALTEKIYKSRDWQKLTPYYRGYFAGAQRILADELYNHLEWRVFWRGALVKSSEVLEGTWNECETDKGQHVWRDAPERIF